VRIARSSIWAVFVIWVWPLAVATAEDDPTGEAHFQAARAHLLEGRPQMALREFEAAVDKDKKNPYFRKGLGVTYLRLNQPEKAVEELREALKLNPYYVDVRHDLGTALILLGKREEGKQEFMIAFNDPTNPTPEIAAANLGRAHFEEHNYVQALSWYRTAVGRNKGFAEAHLGIADCLTALGRADEAIAQLEIGLQEVPDNPALMLALGEALYRAGRLSEARERLEATASKDPGGPSGHRAAQLLQAFPK